LVNNGKIFRLYEMIVLLLSSYREIGSLPSEG